MLNLPITLGAADPLDHVLPHPLHQQPLLRLHVADESFSSPFLNIHDGYYEFYITNHLMMTAVSAVLLVLVFMYVAKRVRTQGQGLEAYQTRGRVAQMFETIAVFVREEVAKPNLGPLADKYIGYIWTVFFFILFANLLGLVPIGPILRLITGNPSLEHWGGTATSNLALNAMLALCSLVAIVFIGVREGGRHFFAHFNPGPLYMAPLLVPLEIMGLLIKCVVLAMRLFGTMMAGHLVIAAFVLLIFTAASFSAVLGYGVGVAVLLGGTALMLLELFIALLQAFIFTFLTVLFIASGAVHHDEHHEHEEAAHAHQEHGLAQAKIATSPGL
ncbi:MAG TPA: F0F1 ATP synthase subunit A [Phycisphaeraceae bacterium]